jgi:hypothetical protein
LREEDADRHWRSEVIECPQHQGWQQTDETICGGYQVRRNERNDLADRSFEGGKELLCPGQGSGSKVLDARGHQDQTRFDAKAQALEPERGNDQLDHTSAGCAQQTVRHR